MENKDIQNVYVVSFSMYSNDCLRNTEPQVFNAREAAENYFSQRVKDLMTLEIIPTIESKKEAIFAIDLRNGYISVRKVNSNYYIEGNIRKSEIR